MRALMMAAAVGIVVAGSGCASVATNRYLQAQNPVRLEAIANGGNVDGAILSVDIFSLDQVKAHPWLTAGAAVVDAAMIYGVYALGDDQGWWGGGTTGKGEGSGAIAGDNGNSGVQTSVTLTGDGNTIIVQNFQPGGSGTGANTPVTAPGSGSNSEYNVGKTEHKE
jgi:hypothetical protein